MDEEVKNKTLFALRLYAISTRTEDLEKLGYKVKVRATKHSVTKRFYFGENLAAVFKFDNFRNYTVSVTNHAPRELTRAIAEFLAP